MTAIHRPNFGVSHTRMPSAALAVSVRCAGVAPLPSNHWTLDNVCVLSPLKFPPSVHTQSRIECGVSVRSGRVGLEPPPPRLCVSETPCLSQIFKGDRRDSLKGVPGSFSLGGLSRGNFRPL